MTTTSQPIELMKPTLSPSALTNYETCGRRGQYYHARVLPRVNTLGLSVGSAWHRMQETFQLARMQAGPTEVWDAEWQDHLLLIGWGYLSELMTADNAVWFEGESMDDGFDKLATMHASFKNDAAKQWQDATPVAIEQEVRVELGSDTHQLHGFIDLVVEGDHGYIGVDHKTAGRAWSGAKADGDPRKLVQAPLYAEAWERTTGEPMEWFAYDVMTYAGRFQRVWVDVSRDVRAPFIERWQQQTEQIELHKQAGIDMPPNPSSFLCSERYCDFWVLCPMGESLNQASK